jgi:cellulose synthase/poly-beta-1,6-N-acetylglucosamine synthase-like glycosyltransferase
LAEFNVDKIADRDDIKTVRPWQGWMIHLQPVMGIISLGTYVVYVTYRIIVNSRYAKRFGHPNASWAFIGAEAIFLRQFLLHLRLGILRNLTWTVSLWVRTLFFSLAAHMRRRPQLRLRDNKVPAVDILITTCGEPIDVIIDTVRGACNLDYPRGRYRIVICDDAADAALEDQVMNLSKTYSNLIYHARVKGVNHHYKAGNLQAGIDFTSALLDGPGEIIATLDSDMIPESSWLRAMLPHLLVDEKVALCVPPQVSALFSRFTLLLYPL